MPPSRSKEGEPPSLKGELPAAEWTAKMRSDVEAHRQQALHTLEEGQPGKAFTEFVRSTRSVPMRASLASLVVRLALAARQPNPAIALIRQGTDETDGRDRIGVIRALARLFRRTQDPERARETLAQLLAEQPEDRRARFVFDALLERDERWEELDASLEKETRLAVRRDAMRTASRLSLKRARLWGEKLDDPSRAALRYGQAAQFAEQAGDFEGAFLLRLLHVHTLHRAEAPAKALEQAGAMVLALGRQVGKADRATELLQQLEIAHDGEAPKQLRPSGQGQPSSSTKETSVGRAPEQRDAARTIEMPATVLPGSAGALGPRPSSPWGGAGPSAEWSSAPRGSLPGRPGAAKGDDALTVRREAVAAGTGASSASQGTSAGRGAEDGSIQHELGQAEEAQGSTGLPARLDVANANEIGASAAPRKPAGGGKAPAPANGGVPDSHIAAVALKGRPGGSASAELSMTPRGGPGVTPAPRGDASAMEATGSGSTPAVHRLTGHNTTSISAETLAAADAEAIESKNAAAVNAGTLGRPASGKPSMTPRDDAGVGALTPASADARGHTAQVDPGAFESKHGAAANEAAFFHMVSAGAGTAASSFAAARADVLPPSASDESVATKRAPDPHGSVPRDDAFGHVPGLATGDREALPSQGVIGANEDVFASSAAHQGVAPLGLGGVDGVSSSAARENAAVANERISPGSTPADRGAADDALSSAAQPTLDNAGAANEHISSGSSSAARGAAARNAAGVAASTTAEPAPENAAAANERISSGLSPAARGVAGDASSSAAEPALDNAATADEDISSGSSTAARAVAAGDAASSTAEPALGNAAAANERISSGSSSADRGAAGGDGATVAAAPALENAAASTGRIPPASSAPPDQPLGATAAPNDAERSPASAPREGPGASKTAQPNSPSREGGAPAARDAPDSSERAAGTSGAEPWQADAGAVPQGARSPGPAPGVFPRPSAPRSDLDREPLPLEAATEDVQSLPVKTAGAHVGERFGSPFPLTRLADALPHVPGAPTLEIPVVAEGKTLEIPAARVSAPNWLAASRAAASPEARLSSPRASREITQPRVSAPRWAIGEGPPSNPRISPPRVSAPRPAVQRGLLAAVNGLSPESARTPEAAAVLATAVTEGPDPIAEQKLEAHYVARGAWRELADFYRQASARASLKADQAAWAEKLAEVLESEIHDYGAAASAWGLVVAATGDARAIQEQVRLLNLRRDFSAARTALDAGVERAGDAAERAHAHVLRAEEALAQNQFAAARANLENAIELVPEHPVANAGLAELGVRDGETGVVFAFERALTLMPRHEAGRPELYRRLARMADTPLRDAKLSRVAWAEVALELPADEEASTRLMALARGSGDDDLLEEQVRSLLKHIHSGERVRPARMELVAILERTGRAEIAISMLREFVGIDPAHYEAWVAIADRLISRGLDDDGAAALDQAILATEDAAERAALYQRLARLVRERLYDDERADAYQLKANALQEEQHGQDDAVALGPLLGGPVLMPKPRPTKGSALPAKPFGLEVDDDGIAFANESDFDEVAAVLESRLEPGVDELLQARLRHPQRLVPLLKSIVDENNFNSLLQSPEDDVVEVRSSDFALPDDEDGADTQSRGPGASGGDDETSFREKQAQRNDLSDETAIEEPVINQPLIPKPPRRQTLEVPAHTPKAPAFGASIAKALKAERKGLQARLDKEPLEAEHYRQLADHFDTASDSSRSSLMLEIARALDGDPNAAPRTPRLILSEVDRNALKHPMLRTEAGEMISLVATALCRLYPSRGRNAGSNDEFRLDAGKGAKATADALLAAVRILGVRAPGVHVSESSAPPFSVVFAGKPRLLVGSAVVKRASPDAELRFYAGRALFTLSPDFLALRSISRDELLHGLEVIRQVLQGKASAQHSRLVVNDLSPQVWARLKTLFHTQLPSFDLAPLAEGARHSANRAGLVVCGGIAPAVEALRAKRALQNEVVELVRFASSDAYLELRERALAPR